VHREDTHTRRRLSDREIRRVVVFAWSARVTHRAPPVVVFVRDVVGRASSRAGFRSTLALAGYLVIVGSDTAHPAALYGVITAVATGTCWTALKVRI
jgi:hypothetical protein